MVGRLSFPFGKMAYFQAPTAVSFTNLDVPKSRGCPILNHYLGFRGPKLVFEVAIQFDQILLMATRNSGRRSPVEVEVVTSKRRKG